MKKISRKKRFGSFSGDFRSFRKSFKIPLTYRVFGDTINAKKSAELLPRGKEQIQLEVQI